MTKFLITKFLIIGAGGFTGAILRYVLSGLIQNLNIFSNSKFPAGTLAVNITGCLIIGFLSNFDEIQNFFSPELKLLIFTGVLGAFTTFSTFGNETVQLINEQRIGLAITYVVLHIVFGIFAVFTRRYFASFI